LAYLLCTVRSARSSDLEFYSKRLVGEEVDFFLYTNLIEFGIRFAPIPELKTNVTEENEVSCAHQSSFRSSYCQRFNFFLQSYRIMENNANMPSTSWLLDGSLTLTPEQTIILQSRTPDLNALDSIVQDTKLQLKMPLVYPDLNSALSAVVIKQLFRDKLFDDITQLTVACASGLLDLLPISRNKFQEVLDKVIPQEYMISHTHKNFGIIGLQCFYVNNSITAIFHVPVREKRNAFKVFQFQERTQASYFVVSNETLDIQLVVCNHTKLCTFKNTTHNCMVDQSSNSIITLICYEQTYALVLYMLASFSSLSIIVVLVMVVIWRKLSVLQKTVCTDMVMLRRFESIQNNRDSRVYSLNNETHDRDLSIVNQVQPFMSPSNAMRCSSV